MQHLRIGILSISWFIAAPAIGTDAAYPPTRLTAIEDEQRSLQGHQEELQHTLEQLRQEIDKLKADIDLRFTDLQNALENSRGARKNTSRQDPSEDFATAHPLEQARALFNAHRYEDAQYVLNAFIATMPVKSNLAVAHYWLGETFFAQKLYEEAALAFVTGYKIDAHGRRTPETLLKLARALMNVKKTKEARTTLHKLLQDYPKAANGIRAKAQELLKKTA
jgi:tol-pal system protein YbgF